MPMQVKKAETAQVAWTIVEWCRGVKIGRTTFYRLEGSQKPKTAQIRGRQIVTESPAQYLERVAGEQEQQARNAA